jgi:hypothetical protein
MLFRRWVGQAAICWFHFWCSQFPSNVDRPWRTCLRCESTTVGKPIILWSRPGRRACYDLTESQLALLHRSSHIPKYDGPAHSIAQDTHPRGRALAAPKSLNSEPAPSNKTCSPHKPMSNFTSQNLPPMKTRISY